jgi:hypothetical protein
MTTIKSYLQNLNTQLSILISFYLENEVLLSHEILSLLDKIKIDLPKIFDLQSEITEKIFMISTIETVAENPRYFMEEKPSTCIQSYTSLASFTKLSNTFLNFYDQANNIALAMLKSNQELMEKLPPLYQGIIINSRKNRENGFTQHLQKITHESPFPCTFPEEYIRITNLIAKSVHSKTTLQFILQTLNQPLE